MTQAECWDKCVLPWSASARLHVLNVDIWLESFDHLCREALKHNRTRPMWGSEQNNAVKRKRGRSVKELFQLFRWGDLHWNLPSEPLFPPQGPSADVFLHFCLFLIFNRFLSEPSPRLTIQDAGNRCIQADLGGRSSSAPLYQRVVRSNWSWGGEYRCYMVIYVSPPMALLWNKQRRWRLQRVLTFKLHLLKEQEGIKKKKKPDVKI